MCSDVLVVAPDLDRVEQLDLLGMSVTHQRAP